MLYWSDGNAASVPAVTVVGFQVTSGQKIYTPISSYNIGGGFQARVLYAAPTRITFTYTTFDNIAIGYAIHVENVCVDPSLISLYDSMVAAGRDGMPALRATQAFGTAMGTEIIIALRDSGAFLDPRVCDVGSGPWLAYTAQCP